MHEEGLAEISFDTELLVVDIMVSGAVGENNLKGVPGELIAAVVVHSLHGGEHKQNEVLTITEPNCNAGNTSAKGVEQKSLGERVVKSTKSVRNIEAVVNRVHVAVGPLVVMHKPVQHILPSVDYEKGDQQSERREHPMEKEESNWFTHPKVLTDLPYQKRLVASGVGLLELLKNQTSRSLDDMLQKYRAQHLTNADDVFVQFLGSVDSVPVEDLENIEEMEEK